MPKSKQSNFDNSNQINQKIINKEDSELFRKFVDNSTILDKDKLNPSSNNKKHPKFLKYRLINFAEFAASDKLFYNNGVSNKVLQKIKQGKVNISASIDLHGLTLEESCLSLADFIYQNQQHKYLHIIHGKGYNANSLSKLKTQTFVYLKDHPQVLVVVSAPENLGGTGAVIVGLKNA